MEQFPDGGLVRLKSRVRGMYLHADEDGSGVSLSPARASLNTAWRVHRVVQEGGTCVLLHGAAYGRYLFATDERAASGHRGQRVVQGVYDDPEEPAVAWKPVGVGDGAHVLVRHITYRLLRANGRHRTWNTGVTVEHPDSESTMMHWVVEAIPPLTSSPNLRAPRTGAFPPLSPLPHQQQQQQELEQEEQEQQQQQQQQLVHPARRFINLFRRRPEPEPEPEPAPVQRTIRFVRANANGNFNEQDWGTFQFEGRSVYNLRSQVAYHALDFINFHRMMVCTRAGRYGRLTPLTTELPRSQEQMDIIALNARSPATQGFRYPDVNAP